MAYTALINPDFDPAPATDAVAGNGTGSALVRRCAR